jgi:hypothetical protein
MSVFLGAAQPVAVRAGRGSPARMASQYPAVFLAVGVDRAEGGCGEGNEDTRVGGDGVGDALAAAQPGSDELVGIGAVDLGARRAARGAAGLAGDGQDSARFVDAGVTVQQFPGSPVDVIDAASHQDGLYAPASAPGSVRRKGIGGQRWYSSRRALAGGWTSGGGPLARRVSIGLVVSGAMPRVAWPRLPAAQAHLCMACGTVTGLPVTHRPGIHTVIPRCGGCVWTDTTRISSPVNVLKVSDR